MIVPVLLFILGLAMLIKGGDWFVDGSTGIARKFHIPEILIGATVVSIGTTLPETMVSATSAVQGHSQIAYGNAIGSVICNTALIAAITMSVKPCKASRKEMIVPSAFFLGASLVYAAVAYTTGNYSRVLGIIYLLSFVAYIVINAVTAVKDSKAASELTTEPADQAAESDDKAPSTLKCVILLVIGAALIAVGARLLVDNGTKIAEAMGVPETVIALTFVALGTSLPELVTAITSLIKGHGALSLGNILGANLFNIILVSGLSMTLSPFSIPSESKFRGHITSLVIDLPVMFAVMALLVIPTLIQKSTKRYQGIILLCIYAAFVVLQFTI